MPSEIDDPTRYDARAEDWLLSEDYRSSLAEGRVLSSRWALVRYLKYPLSLFALAVGAVGLPGIDGVDIGNETLRMEPHARGAFLLVLLGKLPPWWQGIVFFAMGGGILLLVRRSAALDGNPVLTVQPNGIVRTTFFGGHRLVPWSKVRVEKNAIRMGRARTSRSELSITDEDWPDFLDTIKRRIETNGHASQ